MEARFVRTLLLTMLAPFDLGNSQHPIAAQAGCSKALRVSLGLRAVQRCLHENQLREPRTRPCADRFAYQVLNRGGREAAKGGVITLGESK